MQNALCFSGMQNVIHTLTFSKYWWETLNCGNFLPLHFWMLLQTMLPTHVVMLVQCNWVFGGTEGLFCVQQPLESSWVLYFLNEGRMMGMSRPMEPQDIIWIEPRGVWGKKRIIHIWDSFLSVKPGLKWTYCFIVHKGLPST